MPLKFPDAEEILSKVRESASKRVAVLFLGGFGWNMGKAGKLERVRDMVIRRVDKVEVLRKE